LSQIIRLPVSKVATLPCVIIVNNRNDRDKPICKNLSFETTLY